MVAKLTSRLTWVIPNDGLDPLQVVEDVLHPGWVVRILILGNCLVKDLWTGKGVIQ